MLGRMLHQHPAIRFDGESYRHGLPPGMSMAEAAADGVTISLEGTLERRMRTSAAQWFGFDFQPLYLRLGATDVASHASSLRRAGFTHFVILRRANLIRRLASATRSAESGVYGMRTTDERPSAGPVVIPTHGILGEPTLLQHLDAVERFYKQVEVVHARDAVLHVEYERHIEGDPRVAFGMVIDFLGLQQVEPAVPLQRLNTLPTRDVVQNYDEVRKVLRGTEHEWMLD